MKTTKVVGIIKKNKCKYSNNNSWFQCERPLEKQMNKHNNSSTRLHISNSTFAFKMRRQSQRVCNKKKPANALEKII